MTSCNRVSVIHRPGGKTVVSLRTCIDCGKGVSSSAPACPHCGRPSRKSARWPLEIAAYFGLAIVLLVGYAWYTGSHDEEVRDSGQRVATAETSVARPYRRLERSLTAFVAYNRTLHLLRVENRDTFSWTQCRLSLNVHGISGYDLEVEAIRPGLTQAALLQSAEFADPDGKRFDPSTDKIATLDLRCETPGGHLYYGGKFVTEDSRSADARSTPSAGGTLLVSTEAAPKP
jgi:hypothetical protein